MSDMDKPGESSETLQSTSLIHKARAKIHLSSNFLPGWIYAIKKHKRYTCISKIVPFYYHSYEIKQVYEYPRTQEELLYLKSRSGVFARLC